MALLPDLENEVSAMFRAQWAERDGMVVPSYDSLKLSNDGIKLNATILYADLADSTKLVDAYPPRFVAELYKAFLHCAAKIIRSEGGSITAYDGGRVMAVYIGDSKNTSAVRTALKINHAVRFIIAGANSTCYPSSKYEMRHVCGIDTSSLFVARTGVRGDNDLVWVGRAANYAAKLAALPEAYGTYITAEVYNNMHDQVKIWSDGRVMWEPARWNTFDDRIVYRSQWWWHVDHKR